MLLHTNDTVILTEPISLDNGIVIPKDTVGIVIEDLNEVVARENLIRPTWAPEDNRKRELALVKFMGSGRQCWTAYDKLRKIRA